MHKHTQKELIDEGFWDSFKTAARVSKAIGKEIAKVAIPQSYQNIKNVVGNIRGARRNIKTAFKTVEERIMDWIDEMGFTPVENAKIKKIRNFGGGKTHWAIDVGVKGVDKEGNTIIIRNFKEPTAIVQYDDLKDGKSDSFNIKFILRPDRRRMYYDDNDDQQAAAKKAAAKKAAAKKAAAKTNTSK
jgi:hypothetical protein